MSRLCTNCGTANTDDAAFCNRCGTSIQETAQAAAPPAKAPSASALPGAAAHPPAHSLARIALKVAGYLVAGLSLLFAVVFVSALEFDATIVSLLVTCIAVLACNPFGYRTRVPFLGDKRTGRAFLGWAALIVGGIVLATLVSAGQNVIPAVQAASNQRAVNGTATAAVRVASAATSQAIGATVTVETRNSQAVQTATVQAVAAAATAAPPPPNPTPVPPRPTVAPVVSTATPVPPQPTAASVVSTATPVPPSESTAKVIDPRMLTSDPASFVGQNIILQGNAQNTIQYPADKGGLFSRARVAYTWIQLLAVVPGKSTTESIVVEFEPADKQILKDECMRIYGVVRGTQKVTRTLTGATNEVPVVAGYAWASSPKAQYYGCQAP